MLINLDWNSNSINPLNVGYVYWILEAIRERLTAVNALQTDRYGIISADGIRQINWLLSRRPLTQSDCITIRDLIYGLETQFYNPNYTEYQQIPYQTGAIYPVQKAPITTDETRIFPYQKGDIDYAANVPYFNYLPLKRQHINGLKWFYLECRRRLLLMRYTLMPTDANGIQGFKVVYPHNIHPYGPSGVQYWFYLTYQGREYKLPPMQQPHEYWFKGFENGEIRLERLTKAQRSGDYYHVDSITFKLKYHGFPTWLICNMNPTVVLQYSAHQNIEAQHYTYDSGTLNIQSNSWHTVDLCKFNETATFGDFTLPSLPSISEEGDIYYNGARYLIQPYLDWGRSQGFRYTENTNTVDTESIEKGFHFVEQPISSNSTSDSGSASNSDSGSDSGEDSTSDSESNTDSNSGSDSTSNSGSGSETGSNSDSGSITPPGPSPDPDDLTYETEVHFYNTGDISGTITDNEQQTFSYSANVGISAYVRVYYRLNNGTATITGFETLTLNASAQIPHYGNLNITDISVTGICISNYEIALWVTWSANGSDYNQIVHATWQGSSRDKGIADFYYDCNYTWGVVD